MPELLQGMLAYHHSWAIPLGLKHGLPSHDTFGEVYSFKVYIPNVLTGQRIRQKQMEGVKIMSVVYPEQLTPIWQDLSKFVHVLHSEADYQQAVELLDSLIDVVGEDEQHPLASLMELLGVLIEQYEDDHIPEITSL